MKKEEKVFIKKVEEIVERVLEEMMDDAAIITSEDDEETAIPMGILDEMEAFIGEPIMFMAIS